MKNRSDPEKFKFWKTHIEAMKVCGGSCAAYCRQNNIKYHDVKYWKNRIDGVMRVQRKAIKHKSFLPVEVLNPIEIKKTHSLPDAKWVAEIIFELSERYS